MRNLNSEKLENLINGGPYLHVYINFRVDKILVDNL